jgi:Zn-dependent protease
MGGEGRFPLGSAYGCCHNGVMDSSDISLPGPPPVRAGGLVPAGVPAPATSGGLAQTLSSVPPASDGVRPGENPFGDPARGAGPARSVRKRIGSAVAAVAAVVAKFFAAIKGALLLLPKIKLLTTSGTALVSVAAYSLFWGWPFAVGFVVLMFVHEMGHVIALRREGIKASAPMFIPFLGAAIFAKSLGDNALAEARVGLAGPILGTVGAGVVALLAVVTGSSFLLALAYVGFLLNLFNLLPVVPLDGGRAMAAMAPWMWFVGFGGLVVMMLIFPNPILLIILLFGGLETWRRWKQRKTRSLEQAAYYRVSPRNRALVGAVYIGLIVVLAVAMAETHVLASAGHSFRSI